MPKKQPAIQQTAGDVGSDITLQDILDGMEDELLVIDSDYRVRFANSAVRCNLQKGADSLAGRLCYQVLYGRDKPCSAPLWDCTLRDVLPLNISRSPPILFGIAVASPRRWSS